MLGEYGLKLTDVTMVNVNFTLSPSLYTGQVDAVIGAFRNFELNQMDLAGKPGRAFYPEEYGVPLYDELILVANRSEEHTSELQSLMRISYAVFCLKKKKQKQTNTHK